MQQSKNSKENREKNLNQEQVKTENLLQTPIVQNVAFNRVHLPLKIMQHCKEKLLTCHSDTILPSNSGLS